LGILSKLAGIIFSAAIIALTVLVDVAVWVSLLGSGNNAGAVVGFLILAILTIPFTIIMVTLALFVFAAALD